MEALHGRRVPGARDPDLELRPDPALLGVRARNALRELGVALDRTAPPRDSPFRLEARDRRNEPGAREVVRRRKRLTLGRESGLLGDGRVPVRAPDRDAAHRARGAPELPRDDGSIVHEAIVSAPVPRPCGAAAAPREPRGARH